MDFSDLPSTLLSLTTVVAISIASAVIPVVNAELYVLGLGSITPRPMLPLVLVLATLGHMAGKSLMYGAARGVERLSFPALQRRIEKARAKLENRTTLGGTLVFVSAATGFPPFYVVTVAAGAMRYSFPMFFVLGLAGRLLRFGVLATVPHLARTLL